MLKSLHTSESFSRSRKHIEVELLDDKVYESSTLVRYCQVTLKWLHQFTHPRGSIRIFYHILANT